MSPWYCTALHLAWLLPALAVAQPDLEFDWDSIHPSWNLTYKPCYEAKFQCARLLVPLDWLDTESTSGETVALAIIKIPATVPATDERFGGTVITNPGGPADSGVLHVLRNGHLLQEMVDSDNKKFELLSFDPRGVSHTTPRATCFDSETARMASTWQEMGLGKLETSPERFRYHKALATAYGMQCARFPIHGYTTTASVARDVLRIVDKVDELLQQDLQTLESIGQTNQAGPAQRLLTPAIKTRKPARLQYQGTSYGTILGNTILSMFPGRVKRMILDGVVVPEEWTAGDWRRIAADSTAVSNYFYQTCFNAGSGKCPLRRQSDKSWEDLKGRVNNLLNHLDSNPLPVATPNGPGTLVTGDTVRTAIFGTYLYDPLTYFEDLAQLLHETVQGNYTAIVNELTVPGKDDGPQNKETAEYTWMSDAHVSILCGDTKDMRGQDEKHWSALVKEMETRSPEWGSFMTPAAFACVGWQLRPKYRYTGPFTSPEASPEDKNDRPLAPLLLLSSKFDPVTPVQAAHEAAKAHPGARVLQQNSVGHCAFISAPSECTRRHVRTYMDTGELPPEGTECEADCEPFRDCPHKRARLPRLPR